MKGREDTADNRAEAVEIICREDSIRIEKEAKQAKVAILESPDISDCVVTVKIVRDRIRRVKEIVRLSDGRVLDRVPLEKS